jgi:hypothetical protein
VKLYINRSVVNRPWGGGGHFVTNFTNYMKRRGHDVVFDFVKDIDVMLLIDPRPSELGSSINDILQYKHYFPKTKIVHRINECDKRKNTNFIDDLLVRSNKFADETIFISQWLKDYFYVKGISRDSHVVYNGCNTAHFRPKNKSFNNKNMKLVTHHWSDNWLKGFDIYTKIDEYLTNNNCNFEFTYIGRYNKDYIPKSTRLVKPLYGEILGEELRNHDIYVTASRFEPCGMHHIEGAASGMPVLYHEEGGGIIDMCQNHGLPFGDFNTFLEQLEVIKEDYDSYKEKINYNNLDSQLCCEKYYNIIKNTQEAI